MIKHSPASCQKIRPYFITLPDALRFLSHLGPGSTVRGFYILLRGVIILIIIMIMTKIRCNNL